ncbi:MAG: DNA primase [Oscillospiraceae bacterium]
MSISQSYLQELVARNDIVEVIGANVQLKHRGRTYSGLCPFHNEKTPSFVVYPETQSFYCFGCGAGGDAITFTKNINNLDYIEAVKMLAARAGMAMPEENDETGRLRSRIIAINKATARFFYDNLNSECGAQARAYWRSRGLSDVTIRQFGLGYSQNDFHALTAHLLSKGFKEEEILAAAVAKRSEKGNVYDVFRNRAMVPIFDLRGNIIAFGGRNLGDEKPKYINSPETILYKKSRTLFALNLAKKSPSRRYILCEGYMDVIAMHQAGFTTAVAGCGTALTSDHIKMLSEYAEEVVLCYDSDEAGQKAAKRAIELFSYSNVKITVLKLDGAKDPDEFIKKFGKERFETVLNGANNAIEYELMNIKARFNLTTADGRLGYISGAINVLAGRITPTQRDVYAGRLAEETNIEKSAILTQLDGKIKQKTKIEQKQRQEQALSTGVASSINVATLKGGEKALGVAYAEQQIVTAILKNTDIYKMLKDKLTQENFVDINMGEAYGVISRHLNEGEPVDLAFIANELSEKTVSLLSRILAQNYDTGFSNKDVEMYLQRIEKSVPVAQNAGEMSLEDIQKNLERRKN